MPMTRRLSAILVGIGVEMMSIPERRWSAVMSAGRQTAMATNATTTNVQCSVGRFASARSIPPSARYTPPSATCVIPDAAAASTSAREEIAASRPASAVSRYGASTSHAQIEKTGRKRSRVSADA